MKYSVETEIDLPVDKVVELFDNPDNLDKWMEGLVNFETLEGTPGQPGAKSRLHFKVGKRDSEMIETGVYNIVRNRCEERPGNRTRYITDQEFQFKGFMKIIALLMPGAFKKQSRKYLADFKRFAESQ